MINIVGRLYCDKCDCAFLFSFELDNPLSKDAGLAAHQLRDCAYREAGWSRLIPLPGAGFRDYCPACAREVKSYRASNGPLTKDN